MMEQCEWTDKYRYITTWSKTILRSSIRVYMPGRKSHAQYYKAPSNKINGLQFVSAVNTFGTMKMIYL